MVGRGDWMLGIVLFAVTERFVGLIGPSIFALVGAVTGSNRYGILGLLALFAVGMVALAPVDVQRGEPSAAQSPG